MDVGSPWNDVKPVSWATDKGGGTAKTGSQRQAQAEFHILRWDIGIIGLDVLTSFADLPERNGISRRSINPFQMTALERRRFGNRTNSFEMKNGHGNER
jgi:hypothetical protein